MVKTIGRSYFGVFAVLAAMALLLVMAASSEASPGDTTRVSVDSSGAQANGYSENASISPDGRYVVITSMASNLVPGDTNGLEDAFVRDLQEGTTERVSVDSSGSQALGGQSRGSNISSDGRYVVFRSFATNLVPGDTNNRGDIFVRDLQEGTTERVSVDSSGGQANNTSSGDFFSEPSISADGRYVVFDSKASNLVPGDTNGLDDVFVRDLQEGTTERVSVDSSGSQGIGFSNESDISDDGRYVTFFSTSSNLVPGDTNSHGDIFVRDLQEGTTERVSVDSSGSQGNHRSNLPSISADGRYVAFSSLASNLVASDRNFARDVFVRDLQEGTTERVSVTGCPTPGQPNGTSALSTISADGRYVTFISHASNLVADDTNGVDDIFVRDLQEGVTQRVSVSSSGTQANARSGQFIRPSASTEGRYVVFSSFASNLVAGDTNRVGDAFVHERRPGPGTQPSDCIAPNTTANAYAYSYSTGDHIDYTSGTWTNRDIVQVNFDAQDNEGGSGLLDIIYSATGAVSIPETLYYPNDPSPVFLDTEGTTTISYFATDNMGNEESPAKTFRVKIDRTPPMVSSTSPLNNATGVAATANISATFFEESSGIDPDTLTTDTFKVVRVKPTGNETILGTVGYDEPARTATFTPSNNLAKGLYRATLTTGVKDKAGNALANHYTWTFATAGPPSQR